MRFRKNFVDQNTQVIKLLVRQLLIIQVLTPSWCWDLHIPHSTFGSCFLLNSTDSREWETGRLAKVESICSACLLLLYLLLVLFVFLSCQGHPSKAPSPQQSRLFQYYQWMLTCSFPNSCRSIFIVSQPARPTSSEFQISAKWGNSSHLRDTNTTKQLPPSHRYEFLLRGLGVSKFKRFQPYHCSSTVGLVAAFCSVSNLVSLMLYIMFFLTFQSFNI